MATCRPPGRVVDSRGFEINESDRGSDGNASEFRDGARPLADGDANNVAVQTRYAFNTAVWVSAPADMDAVPD